MKHVKLFICLAATAVLAAGCAALSRTPEEQAAEEARVARLVTERLDARKYQISVHFMNPNRGVSRPVDSTYGVTVNGSHLISYLPYFGVAYNLPYGGGKGLNFESEIDEYVENQRRDRRVIEFTPHTDEDVFLYRIEVYTNGNADIRVRSRNREQIEFHGELDPDFDPDQPQE